MKTVLLALALATLASHVCLAKEGEDTKQTPKPAPAKVFKKKDSDGDGFLSKEEFTKGAKKAKKAESAFDKLDKDHDGKLSKKEFAASGKKKPKKAGE